MRLGLPPMRALCERLGRPETRFRPILVAGSNGKGSVASMLAAGLRAAGLRAGLYTSPHLIGVEERFRIDEATVGADALEEALLRVRLASDEAGEHPTYFEATTAAAFLLFADAGCDSAVLEVGMGGRLDATNVVEPALSVITRISLEHVAILGPDLGTIAREKAGIMRPGVPVVIAPQEEEALAALRRAAEEAEARPVEAAGGSEVSGNPDATLDIRTPAGAYPRLRPALAGAHQRDNALTAVRALEVLGAEGWPVGDGAVRAAVEEGRLPGRLEWRPGSPRVLLDGAHNPAGARALAAHLETTGLRPVLLFGCMQDKDARGMLEALLPPCAELVLTAVEHPRAADPARLAGLVEEIGPHGGGLARGPLEGAWTLACGRARERGAPLLVTGSLYLVGEVLRLLDRDAPVGGI